MVVSVYLINTGSHPGLIRFWPALLSRSVGHPGQWCWPGFNSDLHATNHLIGLAISSLLCLYLVSCAYFVKLYNSLLCLSWLLCLHLLCLRTYSLLSLCCFIVCYAYLVSFAFFWSPTSEVYHLLLQFIASLLYLTMPT